VTPAGLQLEVVERSSLGDAGRRAIVELCSDALETDCADLFGFLPAGSTHVRGLIDGRLVGHACWAARTLSVEGHGPLAAAWVDTVVVAPDHQRRGIGTAVIGRLDVLTARFELRALGTERVPFFAGLGWERWEGPSSEVLHDPVDTLMVLRTLATPDLDLNARVLAVD
jgi:GNAT superfamily N-acetyltransferase